MPRSKSKQTLVKNKIRKNRRRRKQQKKQIAKAKKKA